MPPYKIRNASALRLNGYDFVCGFKTLSISSFAVADFNEFNIFFRFVI